MNKLNKLFAILFAVLGVQSLAAQTWTDVTSTYIKNPNLIAEYYSTSDNTAWPVYTTGRTGNTQHPKNWILHTNGTTNHNIGGAFFECWAANQGVKRWTLFQDVTLPAGKYKLTGKYSTNENRGVIKTVAITPNHSYYSPGITTGNWGSWGVETAEFTVYEETQVRVGMISTNFAQCNGFTLTTTGAKQLLADEIAAAPKDLTEAVATAQSVYDDANSDDAAYRSAAKNLYDAIVAYNIENASEENPVDMTGRIANPSFEGVGGTTAYTGDRHACTEWTYPSVTDGGARSATHNTYLNTDDTNDAFYCFNIWNNSAIDYTVSQTLKNMPAGNYKLSACYASDANNTATLYLNSAETGAVLTATNKETFVEGSYTYKLAVDGDLVIGITSSNWYKVDNFKLQYLGADLTVLQEAFAGNYSNLQGLSTNNVPTAFANNISNLLSVYETAPNTKKDLQTANTAISAVVSDHPSIVAAYATLSGLIDLCNEYIEKSNANSADVLTTFQTAISTATTDGNAATTVDAINAACSTLESARQTYAQNAVPVYPYPFDMTFLLPNTTFDSNIDGWKKTGGANWMSSGKNVECYNTTFEFSMEYTGLNSGSWEIQVDAFYRYGGYNDAEKAHNGGTEQLYAILYANNNEVAVKSIMEGANKAGSVGATTTNGVRVPNGPADCDAYFATGCYANSIATVIADGKLKVGIKKETTQGADWTIFDNFKLIYKGIDVTDLQTALSELKEKANGIKETKMGATELTALTNALEEADTESTNADNLGNMISTLQSAYDAAVVSIEFYATVLPYITKAESIDVSIAAEYRTQYDNGTIAETAETVFQKLEVATYEYVTENFTYAVALSDTWNSTGTNTSAADRNEEHWSGEVRKYKNQLDSWGDPKQGYAANSWSIDFNQDVTLPAGEYVFKVAGRKSPDATLELVVTMGETILGTVNDFPSTNDALGINKAGETSFEANDPAGFAKDGKGWGWQWRYVKFELDEEAIVKVAIHAETNQASNWVSFSDYTLQMTEDTYLEANKGGLDAPTAAAEALVNTKPMGNAENEALEAALAMTYTTGAGLQEKINALNAAVANANAWLAAYNEAKAPLVAALERFETDYNDAEKGALDHMNKNRWATAIEKAQAAAEAKDATDSYAGFADATAALVDALDAATVSVNEYASLKSAITEAAAVSESEVNWGDAPFQRPESAREGLNTAISAAESGYDAAEADGEEVTALIDAMVVTLNAPQDAYCITVATDGHGYKDCPVVASSGSITDNNPTGYGLAAKAENEDLLAQLYTFTQVEGNKYRISVTVEGETVYLTYGVLNDSQAGHKNWQIQGNTDIAKAGEFEVVASTTTEGVFRLRNTVTGTFLDCQDGSAIYTDDNIAKDEFALTSATGSADINISADAKLGTCVLMFDAQLPDGLTAYVPESYDNETTVLTLKMVTGGVLPAYTPCLLYAEGGYEGTLTGTVTMNGYADKVTGDDGLLYGAIEAQTITEGYILQKHDGQEVAKFYSVDGLEEEIPISAGKCWLTLANGVEEALETPAAVAFFFRGGGATKLNAVVMDKTSLDGAIYTLDGKRVNTMQRGEIYIINGQKVMVK